MTSQSRMIHVTTGCVSVAILEEVMPSSTQRRPGQWTKSGVVGQWQAAFRPLSENAVTRGAITPSVRHTFWSALNGMDQRLGVISQVAGPGVVGS
jgi:hypothetical protein